jgi:hypothetical protein
LLVRFHGSKELTGISLQQGDVAIGLGELPLIDGHLRLDGD